MLKKIISGGHEGVEKAALDSAIALGIDYGGWTYKGRKAELTLLSDRDKISETPDRSFENRIEMNVLEADGSVIFTHGKLTIGLKLVKEMAARHGHPCIHIDLTESPLNIAATTIRAWMIKNEIEIVYFTGQKDFSSSDIYSEVRGILEGIYRMETEPQDL
jgi:hypothetical protein